MGSKPLGTGSPHRGRTYRLPVLFWCFFAGITLHCKSQSFEVSAITIKTAAGQVISLQAEMARTKAEHTQGLMNRRSLPEGKGMLFIFDRDQMLSFWMKNTRIPLSIAFIARDGRILEIYDMQPFNLSPVQSSRSARFALEVPQDWFDRAGIAVGDSLLASEDLLRNE